MTTLRAFPAMRLEARRCQSLTEVNRLQRKVHSRPVSNAQHQSVPETLASRKHGRKPDSAVAGG